MLGVCSPTSFYYQQLPGDVPIDPESAAYIANLTAQLAADGGAFSFREFAQTMWIAGSETPRQKVWLDVKDSAGETKRKAIESVPIPPEMRPPPPYPGDNAVTIWDLKNDRLYEFHGMREHGVDAVRVVAECSTLEEPGWHCDDAAVIQEISKSPGYFESGVSWPGSTTWGVSGSGILLWPGAITAAEAQRLYIPHAIRIGCSDHHKTKFRFPAQKTDGKSEDPTSPQAGMLFKLPLASISKPKDAFVRCVARAANEFGLVLTDGSSGLAIKCKTEATVRGTQSLTTDAWKGTEDKFGGAGAILTANASTLLKEFPWPDLEVVAESYFPSLIAPGLLPVGA